MRTRPWREIIDPIMADPVRRARIEAGMQAMRDEIKAYAEATIRPARLDEVDLLNALTGRSCLHWGYEPAFLDWEPESITVYPWMLDGVRAHVLQEEDGRVAGYYVLTGELPARPVGDPDADQAGEPAAEPPTLHLDKLFVDADRIGTGRGKRLWRHAVVTARALGATELAFAADPNAAPFYRAMGAIWEREETTDRPGWNLQFFRFPIPPPEDTDPESG